MYVMAIRSSYYPVPKIVLILFRKTWKRFRRTWKGNIKMTLQETGYVDVDWIHLVRLP